MIPRKLGISNSWLSARSALFADNAPKSSFQEFFQNVLGTTRQVLRGFFRNKSEIPSDIIRKQYRLPVETFSRPRGSKFRYFTYRPGNIYKATSRWCSNSWSDSWRKELLKKFYRGGSGPLIGFVGFALVKKPSLLTDEEELENVSCLIRDAFSLGPWRKQGLNVDKDGILSSVSLADLKIDELIATGCNAAIYSARLNQDQDESLVFKNLKDVISTEKDNEIINAQFTINYNEDQKEKVAKNNLEETKIECISDSQFFIPHSEGNKASCQEGFNKKRVDFPIGVIGPYNIAVKVMFNYNAESNAYAIWNEMYKETLPSIKEFSFGNIVKHKVRKKKLKSHPNIVEMYSAFADQLPLLPGAVKNYPLALPTRLQNDGCGRNMTLFLVMKRYHCSLKEYLQSQNISPKVSLLLFAQLLEALVHLLKNGVTHRDLKSDNILLDLTQGISSPKLVITDFGCCLENLTLPYTSFDISKGGNMLLMAPEVVNSEPGSFSVIDYSRSDLWAAGTIAYEIFGDNNPFYLSNLKNFSYEEKDLPPFPSIASVVIQNLVKEILHVNPKQRPNPSFAASVCQVLIHAPPSLLSGHYNKKVHKRALEWMFQLSAQTYLEMSVLKSEPVPVKLELCHTFCSRIYYLEIVQALKYILSQ